MKQRSEPLSSSPNRLAKVVKAVTPAAAALILAACSVMPNNEAKPDGADAGIARSAMEKAIPGSGQAKDNDGKVLDIETTLERFSPRFISHVDKEVTRLHETGKFDGGTVKAGEPAFTFEQNQLGKNQKGQVVALMDKLTYGPAILDESGNLTGIKEDDNAQRLTIYYHTADNGDRGEAYRVDFEQSDPAMSASGVGDVRFEANGRIVLHRDESSFKSDNPAANNNLDLTLFGDGHYIVKTATSGEGIGDSVQNIENLLALADQRSS